MTSSRHVLFAAHPTVGHTNALRAIAAELRARGHTTGFAIVRARVPLPSLWPEPVRAASNFPAVLTAEGAEVLGLPASPVSLWHAARLPRATGQAELDIALSLFTSGLEAQSRAIAAHVERTNASVVVGDYLMPAALLGARLAGRPFVAVYHSALPFPADGAPPFGTTLSESERGTAAWREAEARLAHMSDGFDARVAAAARQLGMRAPGPQLLMRPLPVELNLLATAPELEPGLAPLEGHVRMVGPCLPRRTSLNDGGRAVLDGLPRSGRVVYVSLGTVFNDRPTVYRALIAGAVATGAQVVVSAGASFDALAGLRSPTVQIHRQVPQVELLEHVDAIVTHGGNNTVQECLAAGRPMVVVPFGGDQRANANRVERLGVGVHIDVSGLSQNTVRDAVATLTKEPILTRARELASALATYGGTRAAADAVLAVR